MLTAFDWLSRTQTLTLFTLFACSTPLGIVLGGHVHAFLSGQPILLVKGIVLGMAAGVFLYMGTLHELKSAPMIEDCRNKKGFILMVCGFVLTALVRLLSTEGRHP